ncbi:hypothetical protein M8C21_025445 [Ambrosia artemisiifolia]|uniref:Uncharacterized protein n=1 Tax=Ambrosia artemisiifolia TaxID=4212 RepID=A0AAD5CHP1_AMBAR|nr:hypothetical protein M8C21_025445 [Ambrosia artemisiifolia]
MVRFVSLTVENVFLTLLARISAGVSPQVAASIAEAGV